MSLRRQHLPVPRTIQTVQCGLPGVILFPRGGDYPLPTIARRTGVQRSKSSNRSSYVVEFPRGLVDRPLPFHLPQLGFSFSKFFL